MSQTSCTIEARQDGKAPTSPIMPTDNVNTRGSTKDSILSFFKTYFYNGQRLSPAAQQAIQTLNPDSSWPHRFMVRNPRLISALIPFILIHLMWWSLAIRYDFFSFYPRRYRLFLVTVFGATMGGLTGTGGGPIAFVVMTLAFGIPMETARDFSMMCQCLGCACGTFGIFWMGAKLNWLYIFFSSSGSVFGIVLGFEILDGMFPFTERKISFISIWFSAAIGMFLANKVKKYTKVDSLPEAGFVHSLGLILLGFLGGILTSIFGVDLITYPLRGIIFRLHEKVSIPTSVVCMAITTSSGLFWRQWMTETGAEMEAWRCLAVVVPIIFVFTPIGVFLSSHLHLLVRTFVFFILSSISLGAGLSVIPLSLELGLMAGGIIMNFLVVFAVLSHFFERYYVKLEDIRNSRTLEVQIEGIDNGVCIKD